MLHENQIIDAVEQAFTARGYTTVSKCDTRQCGIDLHVRNDAGEEWLIEAKGGTSADPKSPRYGKPFNSAQVSVHVAKAIHQAMSLRARHKKASIAIALPADDNHRKNITAVGDALDRLAIPVIWVDQTGAAHLPANA